MKLLLLELQELMILFLVLSQQAVGVQLSSRVDNDRGSHTFNCVIDDLYVFLELLLETIEPDLFFLSVGDHLTLQAVLLL